MTFREIQFPNDISLGMTGGDETQTEVIILDSGFEQRNERWQRDLGEWNVGHGVKSSTQLHELITFFKARRGRLEGFRLKNWANYKSVASGTTTSIGFADVTIGIADGTATIFQLQKPYVSGDSTYTEIITKPVAGTVRVGIGGVETTTFTLSTTRGRVTLSTVPANGTTITAGFEYDEPVRFMSDKMRYEAFTQDIMGWADIGVKKIRISTSTST